MKRILSLIMAVILLWAVSAAAEGRLGIVAVNFPCYDLARQVAGEHGDVSLLIHPGVEVHSYEPSPADIVAIREADLFVYIGGEGDSWADGILSGMDGEGPAALRMMDAVTPLEEDGGNRHDVPEYDEHIWTSPKNAEAMVGALCQALCAMDPGNADAYREAAGDATARMDEIDRAIAETVENGARRELVFADRFPFLYLVRQYGLDYVAAFPSCTADTEPTPQTMLKLIRTVVEDGIPAVYTIEMSTQTVARTVAEETGAEILSMHSMQTVTQEEFDAGETWVSLMEKNVEALREGLM